MEVSCANDSHNSDFFIFSKYIFYIIRKKSKKEKEVYLREYF